MRTYEALYIVRSDLDDDKIQTIAKEVEGLVTEASGSIVRSEIWGKRRLAYPVQDCAEGCYVLVRFEAPVTVIARLENHFRLTESVIRYLMVHFDKKTLEMEQIQRKRNEDDLRASASARPRRGGRDDDENDE